MATSLNWDVFVCSCILLNYIHSSIALFSHGDDVIDLTPSNFNDVTSGKDIWLVKFYAPWCGHCQTLAPEWKKAASALKGVVKLGAVDMDKYQQLGSPYGIEGFPTIKIFTPAKGAQASEYQGGRTAQAIVDAALQQVQTMVKSRLSGGGSSSGGSGGSRSSYSDDEGGSGEVIELTDSNFQSMVLDSDDMWLVEFFAPWCGHCKNLKPHWDQAARQLGGKVKLGALDATVHQVIAGRYNVRGYPTIKYFAAGPKKSGEGEEYDGGRTSDDIVRWALDRHVANIPPPEVLQLLDDATVDKACANTQLCVVSVLPHLLDCQSACRNGYLNTLKQMAEKYKQKGWGWLWMEAGAQIDMEEALSIGGFGYPAMAAVNLRKSLYALLRGSFGDVGIHEFLRDVSLGGKGILYPIKNNALPKIKTPSEPWDGKDGQVTVEEEIDLSDLDTPATDSKKQEL